MPNGRIYPSANRAQLPIKSSVPSAPLYPAPAGRPMGFHLRHKPLFSCSGECAFSHTANARTQLHSPAYCPHTTSRSPCCPSGSPLTPLCLPKAHAPCSLSIALCRSFWGQQVFLYHHSSGASIFPLASVHSRLLLARRKAGLPRPFFMRRVFFRRTHALFPFSLAALSLVYPTFKPCRVPPLRCRFLFS